MESGGEASWLNLLRSFRLVAYYPPSLGILRGVTQIERIESEEAMKALGARLAAGFGRGAVVLLDGPLGAGKTTLVRGILEALGHREPVRSPTFNLIQVFETQPPVMHADLYRVASADGLGLEEYLETHLCLIEWPDRATGLIAEGEAWRIRIEFSGEGREIRIQPPLAR